MYPERTKNRDLIADPGTVSIERGVYPCLSSQQRDASHIPHSPNRSIRLTDSSPSRQHYAYSSTLPETAVIIQPQFAFRNIFLLFLYGIFMADAWRIIF